MFYVHLTRPSSHRFMPVRSRHLWNLPTILAEPNLHSQTGSQNKLKKTKCTVFIQHTQNMMAYEGETKIRQRGPGLSVHEVLPRQPNTVCANWGKPRWEARDELFSWWDANIYCLYIGLKNKVPFHQSQIRGINLMGFIYRVWVRGYSQNMNDPKTATSPKCHPKKEDDVLGDGVPFPVYILEHLPSRNPETTWN